MDDPSLGSNISLRVRFERRYEALFSMLNRLYLKLRPSYGELGFRDRLYATLRDNVKIDSQPLISNTGQISSDALTSLMRQLETPPFGHDLWYVYAASAYGVKAASFAEMGHDYMGQAWELLAEASYWAGWASSVSHGEELVAEAFAGQARSENSSAASKVSHKLEYEIQEWAYPYLREQGILPSQARAAELLKIEIKTRFKKNYSIQRLEAWIKAMPERDKWLQSFIDKDVK